MTSANAAKAIVAEAAATAAWIALPDVMPIATSPCGGYVFAKRKKRSLPQFAENYSKFSECVLADGVRGEPIFIHKSAQIPTNLESDGRFVQICEDLWIVFPFVVARSATVG
jgi:hypothetical protein